MKALVLVTWADCENKWRSLEAVGHEVHVRQYDMLHPDSQTVLVAEVGRIKPDFIVYIGHIDPGKLILHPDILRRLRDIAPLIHMCNDAADEPWWQWLEMYDKQDCFSVQVNIDGALNTPIAKFKNGLTLLTPIDHRAFEPLHPDKRPILMSLVGGHGHSQRGEIVSDLIFKRLLDFYKGPDGRSYKEMANIMCRSRFVFNHPMTGSAKANHVKGRVVECGFAGSALVELKNSPTANWFSPGVEYFYYETVEDIEMILGMPRHMVELTAKRFNQRVVKNHHPRIFWDKVLKKAGVRVNASAGA